MEEQILTSECLLYPKHKKARATLTRQEIILRSDEVEEIINIDDIAGCRLLQGNTTTKAQWYLCLFYYPMCKKLMKGVARQRMVRSIGFLSSRNQDDNKETVEQWILVLKTLISGGEVRPYQVSDLAPPPVRKLMVFVNPFSGRGRAMKIYEKYVKPMFAEAQIQHECVKTEYAGQAREMTRALSVEKYDGIVIVSGDGLVHEVVNGLMDRDDWETCIKTPLGIVPGGSGNALAASILYASNGTVRSNNFIEESLFEIIRGNTRDLSLVYAEVAGKKFYSFLSFGWGFTADVDIESEKYRALGAARFTVGCIVRVANMRKYRGMLSYLPANNHKIKNRQLEILKARSSSMNESGSSSILTASASHHEAVDLSFQAYQSNRLNSSSEIEPLSPPSISVRSISDDFSLSPTSSPNTRTFHLQSDIGSTLPPEWLSIEEEFVWVTPVFLSHLGEDMFMMPDAELNDDVMYIYCLKSTVSKKDLMQILLSIEKGTHLSLAPEDTLVLPCKAFRLEPYVSHTGYMTADGELIPHEPLQASVTDIKAKVMCSSSSSRSGPRMGR